MGSVGTDEWLSVSFRHSRASDWMSKTLQQDSLRCVMGSMSKVSEMECRDPGKEPIEADAGLIKCCKEGQFSCHLARCQRTSLPWVFFSPGDVVSVVCTCKQLRDVVSDDVVWATRLHTWKFGSARWQTSQQPLMVKYRSRRQVCDISHIFHCLSVSKKTS